MNTNLETIKMVVDYIETHLDHSLSLDVISKEIGYSKYHLNRMFSNIVGCSMHTYIRRRRMNEAAKALVFTQTSIIEIAMMAGYDTQQSFTVGFKSVYKTSPQAFRKQKNFHPIQLKAKVDGIECLRGDRMMEVNKAYRDEMYLVGVCRSTRLGFFAIGKCWRKLHAMKHKIPNRIETEFLIGLNDYSNCEMEGEDMRGFEYYAASMVDRIGKPPRGMVSKVLPSSSYMVFTFKGQREDSLQPVVEYIYKEWFPQSTCELNDQARYDFARYGEECDDDGSYIIEVWVPILYAYK